MTEELRLRAEEVLTYTFTNTALLEEALTHSSIADNRLDSNERLEFLGDAVLDLVVCTELFRRFPLFAEGELTKIKSSVVSRRACCEVAQAMGMAELLLIGKGIGDRANIPSSLIANVYESITGAIYLDGGYEAACEFVLRTMTPQIDAVAATPDQQNYKAVLQQHAQRDLNGAPLYEVLDEKGPDHSKCFEVCVAINGRRFTSAWAPNKKMAEQKAALMALEELGLCERKEVDPAFEQLIETDESER